MSTMNKENAQNVGDSGLSLSDPTVGNTEPGQIFKRMQGYSPARVRWFHESPTGEVNFAFCNPYNVGLLHKLQLSLIHI